MGAQGREADSLDRFLNADAHSYALESVDAWEDAVGRATALGFTDVIAHWPLADGIYAGDEKVLTEVASRVSR